MATEYTGPSAREMIANRTLAKEIMARNSDPEPVLDADELSLLKQFVNDPSRSNAILESKGFLADPKTSGSLVAYVMSLHDTERPALSTEDISTPEGVVCEQHPGEGLKFYKHEMVQVGVTGRD